MIRSSSLAVACSIPFAVWAGSLVPPRAQEVSPDSLGATTLGQRTVPAAVGVSPQMLEITKARQIMPVIPAPETTEAWLDFQAKLDAPIEAQAPQMAAYNEVTYEVREIAAVRCYLVTPKDVGDRWRDRVFVHTLAGAWVFGGGDSALREAIWVASGNVALATTLERGP